MPVLRNDTVSLWNTLLGLYNYYMPHCMWAQKKPFSGECCLWILRFVDAFSKLFRLPKCSAHQHFLWKCHLKMSSDANNLNPDSESLCVCELSFMRGKEMRAWVLLPHPVIQGHSETSWLVPLSARLKKKKKRRSNTRDPSYSTEHTGKACVRKSNSLWKSLECC